MADWRLATECGANVRHDPEAGAKLRALNEAYEVLVNPELRARYDELRRAEALEPAAERRGRLALGLSLGGQPFVFYCLAVFLCYVVFEGARSATPGKLALGLRVVKYDGSPCGWMAALKRSILRPGDALPIFPPYLVGAAAAGLSSTAP